MTRKQESKKDDLVKMQRTETEMATRRSLQLKIHAPSLAEIETGTETEETGIETEGIEIETEIETGIEIEETEIETGNGKARQMR